MFYLVYLCGIILSLVWGIGERSFMNFVDMATLELILLPCILALFCTRSCSSFGRAFLFAFGKRGHSLSQYRESLWAVKIVALTASASGSLCFIIGFVNGARSYDWSSVDAIPRLVMNLSVAILSLFYPALIALLLLPLAFLLNKQISGGEDMDAGNRRHIS